MLNSKATMGKNKGPAIAATARAPPPPLAPQNSTSLKTTNALPLSTSLPTPSPSPEPASLKMTAAATGHSPAPPSAKPATKNKDKNSKSTTSLPAAKLSSTPAIPNQSTPRTTGHKLSLTLNMTLITLLLSAPLTFPAAISSARQVDIPAWQTMYTSARSDPSGFAHEKYADAVSWIAKLTQPGLSAQQEVWAREEAEAEARRRGLVDALSDVIKGATKKKKEDTGDDKAKAKEARSGVKYTKAKSGDKEWRREKPKPVEAGKGRTASSKTVSASSSSSKTTSASTASAAPSLPNTADKATTDNIAIPNNDPSSKADTPSKSSPFPSPPKDQPIGDTIADILAAFQQNKPKRATSGAEQLLKDAAAKDETTSSNSGGGGKGSSLTKEQQDLADSVAGLIGFFGKVMTDTTSGSSSSNTAAKVPKDDTDTRDGEIVPDSDAGIDMKTSSPASRIEALHPSEESDTTALLVPKDTTAETNIEPVSTNPDNNVINSTKDKSNKPKSPTAPAAEAVGDILNLLSKLNSGAMNKKEPSTPPSSAKSMQPNPAAADLLGVLGQFASAAPKKKTSGSSGSPGAGAGAGGLDLAGILSSLAAAGGNKRKPASTSAGGGGLDLVGILGALAGNTNDKQKGSSSASSSSSPSSGGLDLVNILSSFAAANSNTNNKNKNTRAVTAAGGTSLPPGIDINSAFKMLKMVNAFQGLSKTLADAGSQAGDGHDTQTGGDSAQGKASGGADAMADMMGAGLEALSFFGKVMANMPQQQQSAVAKEVERVGLELDGAPAEQAQGST